VLVKGVAGGWQRGGGGERGLAWHGQSLGAAAGGDDYGAAASGRRGIAGGDERGAAATGDGCGAVTGGVSRGGNHGRGGRRAADLAGARRCRQPKSGGGGDPRRRHWVLTVKIRQPSDEFTFGVGITFIPYPLVLTPVV
jgi:hypothetical protein